MRILFKHVLKNAMIPILTGVCNGTSSSVRRKPDLGIIFRYSRTGRLHFGRDSGTGLPDSRLNGLSGDIHKHSRPTFN